MLDFTKLWDSSYLFGPNPLELTRSDYIFFWTAAVFIIAGIAAKILVIRKNRKSPARILYSRFFHLFLTMGILILLWTGARFENIPWIAAHIAVLLLLLIGVIWLIFIIRYYFLYYRAELRLWEEEQNKLKYLR